MKLIKLNYIYLETFMVIKMKSNLIFKAFAKRILILLYLRFYVMAR